MSKIKKADLLQLIQEQADMMVELSDMVKMNKLSIIKLENEREPKLKQLDQSVFDGLDEKWRFRTESGSIWRYVVPVPKKKELTGSDLCRAMLERGDKYVLCFVSDFSDDRAVAQANMINLMTHIKGDCFYAKSARWKFAVPLNQQTGEPLTANDVGL